MDFEKSPKNDQISPKSKGLGLNLTFWRFWSIFEIFFKTLPKASLGLVKRIYFGLSFIGRIFLEKMDFEKSPKNDQISPKWPNFFTPWKTFLAWFELQWTYIFIENGLWKSLKNGQISPKSKGVNLNFLTIFEIFLKRFKKFF